jgi:putative phage-type endonuclease
MNYVEDLRSIIEVYLEDNDLDYLAPDDLPDLIDYSKTSLETYYDITIHKKDIEKKIKNLMLTVYLLKEKEPERPVFVSTEAFDKLEAHYDYLMNLPQPEQKSKAWFDMRNNMITASSAAAAMGESKYDSLDHFIYEKVFGKEFSENKFVHHGKKYEQIVTMFYQHVYDVKVGEFGLLKHPNIDFIGASPDGICSAYRMDGTRGSPLLGTMVEIKCPFSREIKTGGDVIDGICPYYYWVQVQLQLQCCDLQRCDFIQCSIKEYDTQEDFMNDDYVAVHTENQNERLEINNMFGRNAVIQLLPLKFVQKVQYEKREWYSKYLYPPSLDMTKEEILEWIEEERQKFDTTQYAKDYKFDKACFFRIVSSHNISIMRDDKWFEECVPKLKVTWDRIKFYRENKEEALKFKKIIDDRKKPKPEFVPFNPNAKKNDGFIDSDEKPSDTPKPQVKMIQPIKTNTNKETVVNSGFLDSDE